MANTKIESSVSNFEDEQDFPIRPLVRTVGILDKARVASTALALASSITVLGLTADALAVYNRTHVAPDFFLPLWPRGFDIRPTTALVATSTILLVVNLASLAVSKTSSLRHRAAVHVSVNLAAPLLGFIVALISMAFYYGVNTSTTSDTFQSWTCRWSSVPMQAEPHFDTLCHQSQVSTGLNVMLVPLEAIILGLAGYQLVLEKRISSMTSSRGQKATSPSLS
ncbi:hypothetical protein S40285_00359 [Stachybotrys chlorohalonatus IBT 40285]|uniref:MARVEL domain-containing protein n=1 Tax=Stachybotrys chlorohalonatus (strain IBT 40285) TaxID=1283841 RepID=A0A084QHP0_STAC4|nr:hypothetical protein S40285_00359 [Stachybotrys chlorohalonata IBT 40285]